MTYGTACKTWGIWYFEVERGGLFFASVERDGSWRAEKERRILESGKENPQHFLCLSSMLVE